MKILLLEDDYSLNETIKEFIEVYGYEVDSFFDGLSAYEAICSEYDLYILDINTPKIEGLEVLSKIKEINPFSKVIMISAIIDIAKIREAYALGCDDYVKKPFEVEELLLKIEKIDRNRNIKQLGTNISFCMDKKDLYINNQLITLTKNEKLFLFLLIQNYAQTVSHEQIEEFVYDGESKSFNAIRSMVKRLRKKIPEDIISNNIKEGYFMRIQGKTL